jgi:hypothetical protein
MSDFDSYTVDKVKHLTNTEVVRRLLIKYFIDKGFGNSFDRQMYPAIVQDLVMVIPSLANKIEVVPHAKDVDAALGKAVLSWNLFVLGNHRMYLGDTYHNSLRDLSSQIRSGSIRVPEGIGTYATARRQSTPRRVILFITKFLGDHESGYVDLNPTTTPHRQPGEPYAVKQTLSGMPQQFFTRSGYGT